MMIDWPLCTIRDVAAEIERMYAALETVSLPVVRNAVHDGTLPEVPSAETAHAQAAAAGRAASEPARVENVAEHGMGLAGESWSG